MHANTISHKNEHFLEWRPFETSVVGKRHLPPRPTSLNTPFYLWMLATLTVCI